MFVVIHCVYTDNCSPELAMTLKQCKTVLVDTVRNNRKNIENCESTMWEQSIHVHSRSCSSGAECLIT